MRNPGQKPLTKEEQQRAQDLKRDSIARLEELYAQCPKEGGMLEFALRTLF